MRAHRVLLCPLPSVKGAQRVFLRRKVHAAVERRDADRGIHLVEHFGLRCLRPAWCGDV